ncbi:MAG: ATP-binding protein [Spirochaetaceae bacterium]|nr:ATP-binding protein [Spirochaetaceae bacterium]
MKLKYRLSLLFLVVIAVSATITLVLVRRSTESMFRTLVFSGDAEKAAAYALLLGEYRLEKGDWNEVQAFLVELPGLYSRMIDTRIHGGTGWPTLDGYPATTLRSLMADRVVVADANGFIVADTAGQILRTIHPSAHLMHGIPILAGFERTGTVLVGSMVDSSLTGIDERFLNSVFASLAWSTAVATAVALALGLLIAARITNPLQRLARAAKAVAAGEGAAPVQVRGHDELADLSIAFNEMTSELRRLDAAKKRVIADAAHELRTPVTLIQGTVEGMIDGIFPLDKDTLASVHEETVRLSRLIDTLRELEIIESGELRLSIEGVDLGEAIRKAIALFASSAAAKSIALAAGPSPSPRALARGDCLRIGEVIYNLMSNAIKYTPDNGAVRIAELPPADGRTGFRVDDSGPGIPPEERERIFERFYRIDKSRSTESGGRGLGLAIASEIVKAHGGGITAGASALGGASFTVTLPVFRP